MSVDFYELVEEALLSEGMSSLITDKDQITAIEAIFAAMASGLTDDQQKVIASYKTNILQPDSTRRDGRYGPLKTITIIGDYGVAIPLDIEYLALSNRPLDTSDTVIRDLIKLGQDYVKAGSPSAANNLILNHHFSSPGVNNAIEELRGAHDIAAETRLVIRTVLEAIDSKQVEKLFKNEAIDSAARKNILDGIQAKKSKQAKDALEMFLVTIMVEYKKANKNTSFNIATYMNNFIKHYSMSAIYKNLKSTYPNTIKTWENLCKEFGVTNQFSQQSFWDKFGTAISNGINSVGDTMISAAIR